MTGRDIHEPVHLKLTTVRMSQGAAGPGLIDRVKAWRDRTLASPAFQHWAVRCPLTRGIANRRARALFDLCAGFVYSQVLAACVDLRLFEILAEGPRPVAALAPRLGLTQAAAERLLDSAVALRLVERRGGGRYGLGALGAATLGNAGIADMVRHHRLLYADLRDPVALLRQQTPDTALGRLWPYAGGGATDAAGVAEYSTLMAASQPLIAADILASYDFRRHRCLLDLAGGEAAFLIEASRAAPALRLMLIDLPAVADRAQRRLRDAGLSERAVASGGDIRNGPLPAGADLMSLIRVVHDHDDGAAMAILRTARAALPPGGVLLVAEPMADTPNAETVGAYFQFYLAAMGSGRPRSADLLTKMLREAGFRDVALLPTRRPMLVRVLRARC
jgi:demethylspheroidene O-methyltransferase